MEKWHRLLNPVVRRDLAVPSGKTLVDDHVVWFRARSGEAVLALMVDRSQQRRRTGVELMRPEIQKVSESAPDSGCWGQVPFEELQVAYDQHLDLHHQSLKTHPLQELCAMLLRG